MTDASDVAVGDVLQQHIAGMWCPIAYFSKKLKPAETRYSTFDRELLAVYLAVKHFCILMQVLHLYQPQAIDILTLYLALTDIRHSRSDIYM